MKILAVDTALGACSVAVLDEGRIAAHRWVEMPRGHAEALPPMVQEAMAEAGLPFEALDRLAVTTGPGTFTGQRVGIAFMRGLKLALKRPLVGVTTLEAMAAAATAECGLSRAAVVHDARRGEVYGALYAHGRALRPVALLPFTEMMQALEAHCGAETWALAGTATEAADAWCRVRDLAVQATKVRQPDALWVARLAGAAGFAGETARPLYLREPDAKLAGNAVSLRRAVPADSAVLAGLHAATLSDSWDAAIIERVLTAPRGFGTLAEAHGSPIGFALARQAADEAELLAIGVLSTQRRNGVGRRLLQDVATHVTEMGAATLFLEVAENNREAQTLYEHCGFRVVGKRPRYYGNGGDALVMRAALPLANR